MSYLSVFLMLLGIVIFLLSVFYFDRRFKHDQIEDAPPGYIRTDEINIDPVSHLKTRVYFNPETGDRYYKIES